MNYELWVMKANILFVDLKLPIGYRNHNKGIAMLNE